MLADRLVMQTAATIGNSDMPQCSGDVPLETENYQWEIGEVKSKANPIPVTYLIGVPIERAKGVSSKC